MRYMVVMERSRNGYGAHVPDLPGCIAVGETREETLELIQEAIEMHLESMREQGLPIPEPTATSEYVDVDAA
ncbi:MAG TPA: type II toxin-antitoxin system HicB family antitoxin [Longimicrobiaceae bacterium]|nr:type II toxin-antitoxin system HicB family antitoxin [Longimicrobiaceae bacterium]